MHDFSPEVKEEELVDIEDLSQRILNNEYQGLKEMQNEDYSLYEYENPFVYMRDFVNDMRGSIHYAH